jgi:hypothetical protein
MAEEDHNRFKSNKKWIEWKSLNDGETLLYSQKNYNKPRDEEALKKKIKDKIKQRDDRARKRQGDAGPLGGLNDVSSTIVVNLGVFHEEDEEEEEELEEESEDEESDNESQ